MNGNNENTNQTLETSTSEMLQLAIAGPSLQCRKCIRFYLSWNNVWNIVSYLNIERVAQKILRKKEDDIGAIKIIEP